MITLVCSGCQKKLSVAESLAGTPVKCPECGQLVEASETPTLPPNAQAEATRSHAAPRAEHDSSLTNFLAPPQADDELGRLGKYRILEVLGHGGMGVVFKAEDLQLKRMVAIKAMLPSQAANASAGKRFLREAEAMAAVEHDHVVRIYQIDQDRGVPFLAMEFLKGEPLDVCLKREGKLPLGDVLRIGREIASGLAAAHATGLIHRDIKPGNVWLESRQGDKATGRPGDQPPVTLSPGHPVTQSPGFRVKILDFGLARVSASLDSHLTQQGVIVGTPAYMAPEQARGETVDARCDLWSLGVVLYRMCTGLQPFKGNDSVSTLLAVAMHEPPPPHRVDPAVSRSLSDLVMKLLHKDPAKRIGSAREVVRALRDLEAGTPVARRLPVWKYLSGAALLVLALVGLVLFWRPSDEEPNSVVVLKKEKSPPPDVKAEAPPLPMPPDLASVPFDAAQANALQMAWAKHLGIDLTTTNSVGMKMILIPPGHFEMGSATGDDNEKPVHRVTITRPFYMDVFELSQKAYREVMGVNPSQRISDDRPVERIAWQDAVDFCAKLSAKEGLTYRLPTEAEWEFACRAGATSAWSCGEAQDAIGAYAWTKDNSYEQQQPSGLKKPNPFGLYDMHGNVWEFCSDWYGPYAAGHATDPQGSAAGPYRIFRGGSHFFSAWESRSSNRPDRLFPAKGGNLGVRIVRSLDPPPPPVPVAAPVVSLLDRVDPQRDAVNGVWTLGPKGLASDGGVPYCRLKLPYRPPAEYDFRVHFTAQGGNDILQIFPVGDRGCTLLMGGWGSKWDGFDMVAGHPFLREGNNIVGGPSLIRRGKRHSAEVQVRKEGITARIDGKLVAHHKTDGSDLSIPPPWAIGPGVLGVGTTFDATVFHLIEVAEVSGRGEILAP